jgi:hypothetical protein
MHVALISRDDSLKRRLCREVLATLPALGGQGSFLAVSGASSDAGRGGIHLVAETVGGEKA